MSLPTFLLSALARLPLRVLYPLSDGIGFLLYHLVRYRRKLVRRNLTSAYPTKPKKEIKAIERAFYRFFCDYVVETIRLLRISEEEVRQRFRFTNMELIERLSEDGKPLFCLAFSRSSGVMSARAFMWKMTVKVNRPPETLM